MTMIHVCDFRYSVKGDGKCYELVWSNGKSCRKCYVKDCPYCGKLKKELDKEMKEKNKKEKQEFRERLKREKNEKNSKKILA
jgi:tRNA A22 N-methylase